jgi:hypothetical protein
VSERKVEIRHARRIGGACNRQRARHRQRRNAARFDFPCNQSNGLMANRSDGHQQDDVDFVADDSVGEFRRKPVANLA